MRFNPAHFNRFLANIGQDFLWRRAFSCPCITESSQAPSTKCTHCMGKGHIWIDPTPVGAAAAGQKTQITWAQMGLYQAGDLVMTVPEDSPLWNAGQFDRVTMINATDRFSVRFKRGAPFERFTFTVSSIERVFWISPTTNQLVEGGIPTVDETGRLTWTEREPPPGMSYTITGTQHSEYFIYQDMPGNRNMHHGARLPKLMVMRRWDLLGR